MIPLPMVFLKIATKIGERMDKITGSLMKLKQEMERTYGMMTSSNTYQDCCAHHDYTHNLHFRTNVTILK
jgi:hypothetical protein